MLNAIKFLVGSSQHVFSEFSIKLYIIDKKVEISDSFLGKIIYIIKKVIKNYILHIIMVTLISHVVVEI